MALVGVLARVCVPERERIESELSRIEGVSTFEIPEDERIGILIETPTLDDAHALLTGTIDRVDGVLGTWPVFGHDGTDDEDPDDGDAVAEGPADAGGTRQDGTTRF